MYRGIIRAGNREAVPMIGVVDFLVGIDEAAIWITPRRHPLASPGESATSPVIREAFANIT